MKQLWRPDFQEQFYVRSYLRWLQCLHPHAELHSGPGNPPHAALAGPITPCRESPGLDQEFDVRGAHTSGRDGAVGFNLGTTSCRPVERGGHSLHSPTSTRATAGVHIPWIIASRNDDRGAGDGLPIGSSIDQIPEFDARGVHSFPPSGPADITGAQRPNGSEIGGVTKSVSHPGIPGWCPRQSHNSGPLGRSQNGPPES